MTTNLDAESRLGVGRLPYHVLSRRHLLIGLGMLSRIDLFVVRPDETAAGEVASADEQTLFPYAADRDHWGYIDSEGRTIIKPEFTWADDFSSGLAVVSSEGDGIGYIDRKGNIGFWRRSPGDLVLEMREGLGAFRTNGKWGFVNQDGQIVIEPAFDYVKPFSNGLAAVNIGAKKNKADPFGFPRGGRWGFIDNRGHFVVDVQFEHVGSFSENLCWVHSHVGQYDYIDKSGRVRIRLASRFETGGQWYSGAGAFSDGLAAVYMQRSQACGFIDTEGRWKIAPSLEFANSFSEGMAGFLERRTERWGFLDRSGRVAIAPQFDKVGPFRHDLARVKLVSDWRFIGRNGKTKISAIKKKLPGRVETLRFNDARDFEFGLARVHVGGEVPNLDENHAAWTGGEWLYINTNGEVVHSYTKDYLY